MDSALDDAALIQAARKRILRELEAQQAAQQSVVNNYGGGGGSGGGLVESMHGGGAEDPGLYDYLVDIEKHDQRDENGKSIGWTKKVHRHRDRKGMPGK